MATHLSAYPNPFNESLSLEVEVENNISTIIKIVDKEGKIVKLLSWNLKKGSNKTSLSDLETLQQGEYHVEFKDMNGNRLFSATLNKQ
jgi:predicted phosphatase